MKTKKTTVIDIALNLILVCQFVAICSIIWNEIQKQEMETPKQCATAEVQKPPQQKTERKIRNSLHGNTKEQITAWLKVRHGTSKTPNPIKEVSRTNKKHLNKKELEHMIRAVFQRLPHIKTSPELVALIRETAEAETLRGAYLKNTVSSATGIFQIMPNTAKDMLEFLKKYHKDVYKSVTQFINNKHDLKWNLRHNLPFGIAMCATYYWRTNVDLNKKIKTVADRAYLWKLSYNTDYCKYGSEATYLKCVETCAKLDKRSM